MTRKRTYSDLDEEVPQMLLKRWHVLVQVEEALDSDFDLSLSQVRESRLKQIRDELLDILNIGLTTGHNSGVERNRDFVGLDDEEHVGQNVSLHH